jgi:hypothetical protein
MVNISGKTGEFYQLFTQIMNCVCSNTQCGVLCLECLHPMVLCVKCRLTAKTQDMKFEAP